MSYREKLLRLFSRLTGTQNPEPRTQNPEPRTQNPELFERIAYKQGRHILRYDGDLDCGPSMVLFHGGGWFSGRPRDVEHWVDYLRPKARVINLVEYNVFSVHGQDIDHSFNDCRDALVFLQDDHNTVSKVTETIAFGFSAGGACLFYAALSADNTNLTSMVLVSPVTDLSASGFKAALIPQAGRSDLSPLHLLEQNPGKLGFRCIVLHGTRDTTVSIDQSRSFVEAWHRTQPGPAILIALDEAQHGFHKSSTGFARTRAELNVALFSNSSELVKGPINSA